MNSKLLLLVLCVVMGLFMFQSLAQQPRSNSAENLRSEIDQLQKLVARLTSRLDLVEDRLAAVEARTDPQPYLRFPIEVERAMMFDVLVLRPFRVY